MTKLDLTLFGSFSARVGARALSLPTRKAQALLAYLALAKGRAFERAQLCALLWGEAGVEQAHSSLRQTLFTIRKALPQEQKAALVSNTRSVALDPAYVHTDALELEAILAAPRREMLEAVAALYRGPLLDGLAIDETTFEEWLRAEQCRFGDLVSGALAQLAARETEAGALPVALQARLLLGRIAPWDEDNHRGLMLLYARQGRRSAALAQYRRCQQILQQELGVEPDLATQRLHQELASPDYPGSAAEPGAMDSLTHPTRPTERALAPSAAAAPLVRRERELATLRNALVAAWQGEGQVMLLVGEAGVGKTSLLDALAAQVRREGGRVLLGRCFESEQVLPFAPWVAALRNDALLDGEGPWAALSPENRAALARILPRSELHVDDVAPRDNALHLFEAYLALLKRLSHDAPLFVVLDDLHWADDMSLRLLSFLGRRLRRCSTESAAQGEGAPVFIAATLRKEECARGKVLTNALRELLHENCSTALAIEPLSQDDTGVLVRALTAGHPAPLDARVHAQIWNLSEGNPFVIVEATRALTAGALVSDQSELPVPERVREVIAGHVARLSPLQQQLTAIAAVIGREFEFALLLAAAEHDAIETASAVEELEHAGVFQARGEKLYFSHERIREVVYAGLLPQRRCLLHGHVARTLLSLHAETLPEVCGRLAFHFAKADDRRAAVTYLAAFADHAAASFGVGEALSALAEARQLAQSLPAPNRAVWLLELDLREAKCLFHLGRFAEIAPCLTPHLPLLEALQRPDLKAQVHYWIGSASGLLGDSAAAAGSGERALKEALRSGEVKAARRAHNLLGWEAAYAGHFEKGVEHGLSATVSMSPSDAELEYQAAGFMIAGVNYLYLGRHRQARDALETAIALARENGVARVQALSLGYAGLLQAELGEEAAALALGTEAVALAPDPVTITGTLGLLLHVHVRAGRAEQAKLTFAKLVASAQPLAQGSPQGPLLIALAEAQLIAGQPSEAHDVAANALESARASAHPLIEAVALRLLGQSAFLLGQLDEAEACLLESRTILVRIGAGFQLGRTLCALSAFAKERGDAAGEQRAREEAERLYGVLELPLHAARIAEALARMRRALPQPLQGEASEATST